MSKSPGHRQWPDHKVREQHLSQRMIVELGDEVVAESDDVIRVDEDGSPPRYYFPRMAVGTGKLAPSETTSNCPFKGTAHYFNLHAGDVQLEDAVWSYEDPYEEHAELAGRVAFYDDKLPQIKVKPA